MTVEYAKREVRGGFTFSRYGPVMWRITRTDPPYWFAFDWQRAMVPVAKVRNPLAGMHNWKLRLGHVSVGWRS